MHQAYDVQYDPNDTFGSYLLHILKRSELVRTVRNRTLPKRKKIRVDWSKGNKLTSVSAITIKWTTNDRWGWESVMHEPLKSSSITNRICNRILVRKKKQQKNKQTNRTYKRQANSISISQIQAERAAHTKNESASKRDGSQFKTEMCVSSPNRLLQDNYHSAGRWTKAKNQYRMICFCLVLTRFWRTEIQCI